MAVETFATLAETTTTADPGSGGTSLAVTSRSLFPQSGQFRLLVQDSETSKVNREIMLATAGWGSGAGSFTVTRGLEGTTGVAHASGSYVAQVLTKEGLGHLMSQVQTGSAYYYFPPGTLSTSSSGLNALCAYPCWLPGEITLDRIGIEVTTGVATATPRLGLYKDTGGSAPGVRLLDAGTVDGSTTGYKEITISQAIASAGLYWLAVVNQVAQSGFRSVNSPAKNFVATSYTSAPPNSNPTGFYVSGVSGALPDQFGTGTVNANSPRVYVRVT